MDVATVDLWATSGRSSLHRSSATAKIVAAALCLAAVIVVQNLLIVLAIFLLVLAATRRAGLPVRQLALGAGYAGVFAGLFAFAQYAGDLIVPLTTIAKAITAASVALLLISTTPYPRLFAVLGRILPGVLVDIFYMTYRSIFILLKCLHDVMVAVRLRGGLAGGNILVKARNLGTALALSVLHTFDVSERTYTVMRLRGYSGGLSGERVEGIRRGELPLIGLAMVVAAIAFVFRYAFVWLNPYSWLPLAIAVVVLIVSLALPLRALPANRREARA